MSNKMTTDTMLINKFKSLHKDKHKIPLIQKLIDLGIVSWIIYNLYKIWTLHGAYRLLINAFPAIR